MPPAYADYFIKKDELLVTLEYKNRTYKLKYVVHSFTQLRKPNYDYDTKKYEPLIPEQSHLSNSDRRPIIDTKQTTSLPFRVRQCPTEKFIRFL